MCDNAIPLQISSDEDHFVPETQDIVKNAKVRDDDMTVPDSQDCAVVVKRVHFEVDDNDKDLVSKVTQYTHFVYCVYNGVQWCQVVLWSCVVLVVFICLWC